MFYIKYNPRLQLQLDRYHQSKLPLVTKSLVKSCPRLVDMIKPSTGNLSKYKFEIVAKPEVTFKTLSSDLGQVGVIASYLAV